ncbi:MAG: DUF6017 domain-containing protein [Candidatus Weimeria sp.]
MAITFDYFHGDESNMHAFVRVPKALITEPAFESLDNDDRLAYAIMLDRVSLSIKNNWIDAKKRVFIYFSIEDACNELNIGKTKVQKIFRKLDIDTGVGLIERVNQGQGKPALIYVKNFFVDGVGCVDNSEKSGSDCCKTAVKTIANQHPRLPQNGILDYRETASNNTKENNTELIKSNPISSATQYDGMGKDANVQSDYEVYESLVKKNIEYDYLVTSDQYKYDKETIDGIVDLMTGIMTTKRQYIVICGDTKPRDVVKSQLMKLNQFHIGYVVDCLKKNDTKVKNMKQYMLAALYNAPITMDSYYDNWVNSDKRVLAEQKASGF